METYLVGGAVRDKLLHYPHHEHDWVVVGATPEELLEQGYQPVGRDFPVFLHPQTNDEYALARTERKTGPGYTGFACYAHPEVTLEDDLMRRDLTINAMAEDAQGNIIDPFNGRGDLEARVLRHVSPAFVEDPLRVLRVARFAARYAHLGFSVAPETRQLMQRIAASGELTTLPGERLWKELERALGEQSPEVFFDVLDACGALEALMPELQGMERETRRALQRAAEAGQPVTVRFALLASAMDSADTEALCSRLKAPNQYRHLAQLVARYAPGLASPTQTPQSLLAVLTGTDAFRKPERFQQFIEGITLLYPASDNPGRLRRALAACNRVDPGAIAAGGLKGKAIQREIQRQREAAIAQTLSLSGA